MIDYDAYDIVKVPFPFTDSSTTKRRPALILSSTQVFSSKIEHSVMAMITTKGHSPWPFDINLEHLQEAGLSVASIVRFKLFTLDHRVIIGKIGKLAESDRQAVCEALHCIFPRQSRTVIS